MYCKSPAHSSSRVIELSYSLVTGNSLTTKSVLQVVSSAQQVNAALTLRQAQAAQSKIMQVIIATLIALILN